MSHFGKRTDFFHQMQAAAINIKTNAYIAFYKKPLTKLYRSLLCHFSGTLKNFVNF